MAKKKIQKSLKDYLSKIKKPPTPQLPLPPLNSLPPKNWIRSACKHPKTQSFTVDRDQDGDDNGVSATLVDVDRFLLENFKSLYIKGDDDSEEEGKVLRHGVGRQMEEGNVVLFDSPRLIYPPLNLRCSKRFFIAPGSSRRSLMEEARSSLTTSEDVGSSSTSSTTNTVSTTATTITSAMDPAQENEIPRVKKVKLPCDCIAVVRKTQCPYRVFMLSMQEVVGSRRLEGTVNWDFMEEMLLCYLNLNDMKSHKYILSAFVDLVVALRRDSNNKVTSRSRGVRSDNKK